MGILQARILESVAMPSSILHTVVCIYVHLNLLFILPPTFPFGNHKFAFYVCGSNRSKLIQPISSRDGEIYLRTYLLTWALFTLQLTSARSMMKHSHFQGPSLWGLKSDPRLSGSSPSWAFNRIFYNNDDDDFSLKTVPHILPVPRERGNWECVGSFWRSGSMIKIA